MVERVVLPELGQGVTEAFVVAWLAGVGDQVAVGTPLVEVMTDKANVEIVSTATGRLAEQCFPPEARVGVGQTLALVDPAAAEGVPHRDSQPI